MVSSPGFEGPRGPSSQLTKYLRPGEMLLWSGRPDPAVRFSPGDGFLIPFSILWAGFACFWEISVVAGGAPILFALFGVPFVVIGVYFVFGRFIYKRRLKLRTAYGITPQRALIAVGDTSLSDMPLGSTPTSISKSRSSSHVSVTFGQTARPRGFGAYGNTGMEVLSRGVQPPFAFYDVAKPSELLNALERARSGPDSMTG